MTYYASIISKTTGYAICGKYFDSKEKAREYAKPSCGYDGSIVIYDNGKIINIEGI